MDFHRGLGFIGANLVESHFENSENSVSQNLGVGPIDQADWTAGDGICDKETSFEPNPKYNNGQSQLQLEVGSEVPNKKARNSISADLEAYNPSKAIGKMFYKTKICCKFRFGSCSFNENSNYAHSINELREPPPNWQEVVSAYEEEHGASSEPMEVLQIPIIEFSDERQVSSMKRRCWKFFSREGCPYGENCNFSHDENLRERESVAICLLPSAGGGYDSNRSKLILNNLNWKTRRCKQMGYCPFGGECQFARGTAGLHHCHGGLVKTEGKDSSACDTEQAAVLTKASASTANLPVSSVPHSYRTGVPLPRLPKVMQNTREVPVRRWKGPNKISKIYGDWIDDLE